MEPLSGRDIGASRDDECNLFSYGPFRPEKARKIELKDPRMSGGYGRQRRPRAAAGHQPGRRLTSPLSCLNETARFEVSNRLETGTCPERWAYFGARTPERNDLEERPPDASHGCAHCSACFGPADADQRDRLRRLRAGGRERAVHAVRAGRLRANTGCSAPSRRAPGS